jgi:hypothetical protein
MLKFRYSILLFDSLAKCPNKYKQKINNKSANNSQSCFLGQPLIEEKIQWWSNYKFGKLKYLLFSSFLDFD